MAPSAVYPIAPGIERQLQAFELSWARQKLPYEESAIVTPQGKLLRRTRGGPSQSWPGVKGALQLRGNIFTHLHPPSSPLGSLSGWDLFFGAATKALMVRAVCVVVGQATGSAVDRYQIDTRNALVYTSRAWAGTSGWPTMLEALKLRKLWQETPRQAAPVGTPVRAAVAASVAQDQAIAGPFGVEYDMVEIGLMTPQAGTSPKPDPVVISPLSSTPGMRVEEFDDPVEQAAEDRIDAVRAASTTARGSSGSAGVGAGAGAGAVLLGLGLLAGGLYLWGSK